MATRAVELTIHHLDLGRELDLQPPSPEAVALARATVESLCGGPLPAAWEDESVLLVGSGRLALRPAQREEGGRGAARLPVLG